MLLDRKQPNILPLRQFQHALSSTVPYSVLHEISTDSALISVR